MIFEAAVCAAESALIERRTSKLTCYRNFYLRAVAPGASCMGASSRKENTATGFMGAVNLDLVEHPQ